MKCLLCSLWKSRRWETVRHTGQWIYQRRNKERRIVKGPRDGNEKPDDQWKETGVFKCLLTEGGRARLVVPPGGHTLIFYSVSDCSRKSNQHWEMAGLARQDGDTADAARQTRLAQEWHQRARDGGCEEKDAPK